MNKNSMLISRHAWLQSNTKERLTITDTNEIKTVQRQSQAISKTHLNSYKAVKFTKMLIPKNLINPKISHFQERSVNQ
jgi:hypothetical protein